MMTNVTRFLAVLLTLLAALDSRLASTAEADDGRVPNVVMAIHGGISVDKKEMTPEKEKKIRAGLEAALRAGHAELQKSGRTGLDAVEAAIRLMEDSPTFNAGKGAVFTHEGRNELDASIMEGRSLKAGAVGGVTTVKNPITAARAVMEKSKHVLLIGQGAEVFAKEKGLDLVDPSYFRTEERWQQHLQDLRREKETQRKKVGDSQLRTPNSELGSTELAEVRTPYSTVGAVAVDSSGTLAAGTSTGGMSNKRFGRLGDSPIIGAGTYADNAACAVSCTGHGEYFIRWAVSHDIACLMKYKELSVDKAAAEVIQRKLKPAGGEGGAIALDAHGNYTASYNSEGMSRAYITKDGKVTVRIYEK